VGDFSYPPTLKIIDVFFTLSLPFMPSPRSIDPEMQFQSQSRPDEHNPRKRKAHSPSSTSDIQKGHDRKQRRQYANTSYWQKNQYECMSQAHGPGCETPGRLLGAYMLITPLAAASTSSDRISLAEEPDQEIKNTTGNPEHGQSSAIMSHVHGPRLHDC
jgi:hypothetical protein